MMGFFSVLNLLVSIVYPIIASCRSFEDYTLISNRVASQNFKIGGITVPLNLIYNPGGLNSVDANDEKVLQLHLISIQKWFIYWIVLACFELVESLFSVLVYLIPAYSVLRLGFNCWLVMPMISFGQRDSVGENAATFDNSVEWKKFTSNGAGLVFFSYIKPWMEKNIKIVNSLSADPSIVLSVFNLTSSLNLSNLLKKVRIGRNTEQNVSDVTGSVADYASALDSSFVMVMNIKNKFTGSGDNAETEAKGESADEEFDVINSEKPSAPEANVSKRTGYFW
ncbi:hypothetical protein KGF56_002521 [Candida oxycetoniae]|uniref:Protein YOP1 n=1 Tax=Candida oxycetoniae TaxID=497107 RepID=A0AAI9SXT5_9ASCO|nr:uncharacterized protein KGF56_002521 [Candida oxycetoniae]KAI3404687.2 hypothetical protein KGF56_002521 [Candida oxycetoniae]